MTSGSDAVERMQSRAVDTHYSLFGNLYLNATYRCDLRCRFCPKFRRAWSIHGYRLRLARRAEPSATELLAGVPDPCAFKEAVFCGLGEPTLRLYTVLEVGRALRRRGVRVRLNTDGLASLRYGRDVAPDLEGNIDAVSISLNAQDAATYARICRPRRPESYAAMLEFAAAAREFVPQVTLTAIEGLPGVDVAACRAIARRLGVGFRARRLDDILKY